MSDEPSTAGRVARLRALDVCAVSDALDLIERDGVTTVATPVWPVRQVVAGVVRSIQAGPRSGSTPADHIAAAAVDDSGPEHVLVIANSGREDVSCWGGILTQAAARNGIAAVLVDGACRDVAECEAAGFPVFARRAVPTSARGRIVQTGMDEPIDFAGITTVTGDFVIADRTGVAFVRAADIDEVLELAERVVARESSMAVQVADGHRVSDVMHDSRFPSREPSAQAQR